MTLIRPIDRKSVQIRRTSMWTSLSHRKRPKDVQKQNHFISKDDQPSWMSREHFSQQRSKHLADSGIVAPQYSPNSVQKLNKFLIMLPEQNQWRSPIIFNNSTATLRKIGAYLHLIFLVNLVFFGTSLRCNPPSVSLRLRAASLR